MLCAERNCHADGGGGVSVLIKGMEMSTSCVNCRFSGFGGLRNERVVCMHTGSNAYVNAVQYLDDCPLIPVPPHGRLIDADALIDWIYSDEPSARKAPFRLCTADRSDVKFLLKQAPIIIPAEGEDS